MRPSHRHDVGFGKLHAEDAEKWAKVIRAANIKAGEINAGLADSKIKARLLDLGGAGLAGSPADFGKLIADETEKWGKVIKFAGIKPD